MKLEEGRRYDFLVQKTLDIGSVTYYLLRGPSRKKYLLRKDLYEDYDIQMNTTINCRVDKINCRGEVFLEPENPHYSEGGVYCFEIKGRDIRVNESGDPLPVLLVRDKFGNELVVPMNLAGDYEPDNSKSISLKVLRINKGRIMFTENVKTEKSERIEEDSLFEFEIYDKMKGLDGKDYFMVRDKNKRHHLLASQQYSYYGLEKGRSFMGRYIKYKGSGDYKIEPLNPYYEAGKEYDFRLISEEERPDGPGKILIVEDEHGLRHEVFVQSDYQPYNMLSLRVEKIRKGWPLLRPV